VESQSSSNPDAQPVRGGILLAGPPASGKRTAAFSLTTLRRAYAHVPALSIDPHRSVDGEKVARKHLDELHSWAQIFHSTTVDGVQYSYDRERLVRFREQGRLPIVCVEDVHALAAFEGESEGWLPVLLWCPRHEAEKRLTRGWPVGEPAYDADRSWFRRWERSTKSLFADPSRFTLSLRSDKLNAVEIARIIHLAAQAESTEDETTSAHAAAVQR
jgi:hypothetical protein